MKEFTADFRGNSGDTEVGHGGTAVGRRLAASELDPHGLVAQSIESTFDC